VGIAVPDPEYCVQWGKSHGLLPADMPPGVTPPPPGQPPHPGILKLCSLPEFKNAVFADMDKIGKADKLRGYDTLKLILGLSLSERSILSQYFSRLTMDF
jgi:hypothetical protein